MNSNNYFSINRFGFLFRYDLIHAQKRVLLSLFTIVGIFFIFLFYRSYMDIPFLSRGHDNPAIFLVILGFALFGTAFPAFRTREKSQVFIMIPASAPEKFIFEFVSRMILFLTIPIILWLTYLMEGHFFAAITNIPFTPHSPFDGWEKLLGEKLGYVFFPSIIMLILVILFMGASIFMKNPIKKTLFFSVVILLFHFFTIFLPGRYFKLGGLGGDPFWIKEGKVAIAFFSTYIIILTICFLSVAYFKLKEKEV